MVLANLGVALNVDCTVLGHTRKDIGLTEIGTMRRRQLRCAMHELCRLFDRMQNPDAEEKEDYRRESEGLGQVNIPTIVLRM